MSSFPCNDTPSCSVGAVMSTTVSYTLQWKHPFDFMKHVHALTMKANVFARDYDGY